MAAAEIAKVLDPSAPAPSTGAELQGRLRPHCLTGMLLAVEVEPGFRQTVKVLAGVLACIEELFVQLEEEQAYWDAVYDYEEQKCAEYYGSHNPLY